MDMQKFCFGVDIGGTSIKMGLFADDGTLVEKWSIPTDLAENGAHILSDIAGSIQEKITQKGMALSSVLGVGIGVPGPVDENGVVHKCVNLGWGTTDVKQKMEALLQLPVFVGNDANVAALGEMFRGGGKGFSNLVMVTLGTGVGGGIILNGKIVHGSNGAGGEIGHLHMRDNEPEPCGCGNHGCLEQYASATGIVRLLKRYLTAHPEAPEVLASPLSTAQAPSAKQIFDEAKQQDALAQKLVEEVCDLLGKALANISCVVDPQVFVIGGGVSQAGDILLSGIQAAYRKYAFHAAREASFRLAELGNDAGIYGCAKMVLE